MQWRSGSRPGRFVGAAGCAHAPTSGRTWWFFLYKTRPRRSAIPYRRSRRRTRESGVIPGGCRFRFEPSRRRRFGPILAVSPRSGAADRGPPIVEPGDDRLLDSVRRVSAVGVDGWWLFGRRLGRNGVQGGIRSRGPGLSHTGCATGRARSDHAASQESCIDEWVLDILPVLHRVSTLDVVQEHPEVLDLWLRSNRPSLVVDRHLNAVALFDEPPHPVHIPAASEEHTVHRDRG